MNVTRSQPANELRLDLESLAFQILDDHVTHCVASALASGNGADAAEKSRELIEAVRRFSRTR